MSGTVIRLGRYRTTPGPDIALIYDSQQLASFTNPASDARQLILYKGGMWAGRYSGVPIVRAGLHYWATDAGSPGGRRPGGVAAYTQEMSPTTAYAGGITPPAGESLEANLTTPFLTEPNYPYTVSGANGPTNTILGIAMYQASAISETNEWFYRKEIPWNTPQDASGSSASNQGQLAIWFEGEENVPPNTPSGISPSGANLLISRNPTISANFSDANETLNNGLAWDRLTQTLVEVYGPGGIVWSTQYANSTAEQNARRSSTVCQQTLDYGVTYTVYVYHIDRGGKWSAAGSTTFSIKAPNTEPYAPDNLSPSGGITGGLTPTLSMRHLDPDGNASSMAHMQVRRKSNGASVMDASWSVSVGNGGTVQRVYNGATLSYNVEYEFRGRTMDTHGAWGQWSGWVTFQITSLSGVDTPSSPAGKQTSRTPSNVVAVYNHNAGVNSKAFSVYVYTEQGSYLANSVAINKTVAPGGTVTITWAETGLGDLPWGGRYQVRVHAMDANDQWAPSLSPPQNFNINAAPAIPSGLSPNGQPFSDRPKLVVYNFSDPDPDDMDNISIYAVLTTNAGTFTRAMTWYDGPSRFEYQTTATDLPTQSNFNNTWQAYAYDDIVYSGGTTVAANAAKSAVATFVYAAGPVIEITSTASPIETMTPTLTWTSTQAQQAYRVYGYIGSDRVYDSGLQTSTTLSHQVTPFGFIDNHKWNTGETVSWEIQSTSSVGLTGTSPRVNILLQYTAPPTLALFGDPIALPQTRQDNAMSLWHGPTSVAQENFEGYVWRRSEADSQGNEIAGTSITLALVMNPGQTQLIDASVVSKQMYRWTVSVRERRGNDIVESEPLAFIGKVEWRGIVIHAPADPLDTAVELYWGPRGGGYDVSGTWSSPFSEYESASGSRIPSISPTLRDDARGTFTLRDGPDATADQRMATLSHLLKYQRGIIDGSPHTVCWRSGRGGILGIIYGVLEADVSFDYAMNDSYEVRLGIKSADYALGITL